MDHREHGPRPVHSYTSDNGGEGYFQPDREAGRLTEFAAGGIHECSPAQGDYRVVAAGRLAQIGALELAEMRLSGFSKDPLDRLLLASFDLFIEIDKCPAQPFGQEPADGGFAGSHESDEIEERDARHA